MENINFTLTYEQAKDICEHYEKDISKMEDWEICELVDKLIDEALFPLDKIIEKALSTKK